MSDYEYGYKGKVVVNAFVDGRFRESTDEWLVDKSVKVWNASCDLFNDESCGMIKLLNEMWHRKHPGENPNASEELMSEYDGIHTAMLNASMEMLSWSTGIDLEHMVRVRMLQEPTYNEAEEIWTMHVEIIDI